MARGQILFLSSSCWGNNRVSVKVKLSNTNFIFCNLSSYHLTLTFFTSLCSCLYVESESFFYILSTLLKTTAVSSSFSSTASFLCKIIGLRGITTFCTCFRILKFYSSAIPNQVPDWLFFCEPTT